MSKVSDFFETAKHQDYYFSFTKLRVVEKFTAARHFERQKADGIKTG
jgi:hypothetical protein